MARRKNIPIKSSKNQAKGEGSRPRRNPKSQRNLIQDVTRQTGNRLASKAHGDSRTAKRKPKRGRPQKIISSDLPPELRQAGLLASQDIVRGKCFGPFRGIINKKKKVPDSKHHFVCQVNNRMGEIFYFHVLEVDKAKCSWLKLVKSCGNKQEQNMVAHNMAMGVCYEAIKDISAGEELVAFYDDSFGKKYPAYVEAISTSTLPSETERSDSTVTSSNQGDQENDSIEENQAVKVNIIDDDGDDTDGFTEDETEGDGNDDDDPEYVPSHYTFKDSRIKPLDPLGKERVKATVDDDDDDELADEPVPPTVPEIAEITIRDDEKDEETVKYRCTHCSIEFESRDAAEQHIESKECVKNLLCQLCGSTFTLDTLLENHSCQGKPRCGICNIVFESKLEKRLHLRKCHAELIECPVCHKNYNRSYMRDHLQSHNADAFKCDICEKQFSSRSNLCKHKRKHNPGYIPPPDPRRSPKCKDREYWCHKCNIQFETRAELRRHKRKEHPEPSSPVECPVCHKKYNNNYMRDHLKSHNSDAFKCDICEKLFSSRSNLCKHKRKHNPDYVPRPSERKCAVPKRHECVECHKKFDTPTALEVHKRSHTGERPYACEKCDWKFSQKTHLTRHMKTVHNPDKSAEEGDSGRRRGRVPGESAEQRNVPCGTCGKIYASLRVFQVHMQTVHLGERPHKCNHCDTTFTQRGHLWRHKHSVHPDAEEVKRKIESGKHACKLEGCGQAFPCHSELLRHVIEHTGEKQFLCDQCGAAFASKGNLNKHKRRRHRVAEDGDAPESDTFPCSLCGKVFSTATKLQFHTRSHTGEKPYRCDMCNQGFVQKSGLSKHIRCKRCPMIEGPPENPYPCKVKKHECKECNRRFPGPSDLKAHERTHTGEKPFQCTICSKAFSQPGNLSKHIRYIHRKEKRPKEKPRERRFFCSLCGKAFMCPSSLNMHCRTHTGSKPFACEQCDQSFAQAGNLKKHINRCHDEHAFAERKNRAQKRKAGGEKKLSGGKQRKQADKAVLSSSSEDENSSSESENESANEQGKENESDDVVASMCHVPRATAEQLSPVSPLPMHPPLFMSTFPQTPLNTANHGYFLSPLNTMMTTNPSFMMRTQFEGPQGPHNGRLATHRVQNEESTTDREQCLNSNEPKRRSESRNHSQSSSDGSVRPALVSSGNVTSTEQLTSRTSSQSSFLASVEGILSRTAGTNLAPLSGSVSSARPAALPHMHTMLNTRMPGAANMGQNIHGTSSDISIFPFSPNIFHQP